MATKYIRVDYFFRAEAKTRERVMSAPAKLITERVPVKDARTIDGLLAHYTGPRGSHRSGLFEIQTDFGIWSREDLMRIDISTEKRRARVRFESWDELAARDTLSN